MIPRRLSSRHLTVCGVAVLGLLLLGGLWFFSDTRAAGKAHDDALSLWESQEPTAYSFDYGYCSGMCAGCLVHVTVRSGEVTDAVGTDPAGCALPSSQDPPTIEEVFAMEKSGRSAATTDSFKIDYDPTWGFPASVSLDCAEGASDCGTGYVVTHFRAEP